MQILGQRCAEQYSRLSIWAFDVLGKMLWKVTPKVHLWEHLTEMQSVLMGNPRFWWCYPDEDLVGLVIEVAHSCHPATIAMMVLVKWMHLSFDESLRDRYD